MSKQEKLQQLAEQMHALILRETQDLLPPTHDVELIRKKMSVFAYGIATELSVAAAIDPEELYHHYLMQSGLSKHQAHVVVERTSLVHMQADFADECFQVGRKAAAKNSNSDSASTKTIIQLLFEQE